MSHKSIEQGYTPTESLDSKTEKKKLNKKAKVGMAVAGLITVGSALAACSPNAGAEGPSQEQSQGQEKPAAKPSSPLEKPSNIPELGEIQEADGFGVEAFGNIEPGTSPEDVTKLLTITKQEVAKGNEELLGQKMANALEFMYNGGSANAELYEKMYENPEEREDILDKQADVTVDAVMDALYGDDWEMGSKEVLDFADEMTDITRGGMSDRFDSHILNLETMEPKNEDASPHFDDNVLRTRIDLVGVKTSIDSDNPTYNIVYNRKIEGVSENAAVFNQEGFDYNDKYHNPDYFTDKGRREGMEMTFDLGRTKEQGRPVINGIDQGADENLAYPN